MADLNAIIDKLDALTIPECEELVSTLEEKWGVEANPYKDFVPPPPPPPDTVKSEFDVELTSFGTKKIQIIKGIRSVLGLPLKEAKEFVERAPVLIKEGTGETDAEEIKRILELDGAIVTIK